MAEDNKPKPEAHHVPPPAQPSTDNSSYIFEGIGHQAAEEKPIILTPEEHAEIHKLDK